MRRMRFLALILVAMMISACIVTDKLKEVGEKLQTEPAVEELDNVETEKGDSAGEHSSVAEGETESDSSGTDFFSGEICSENLNKLLFSAQVEGNRNKNYEVFSINEDGTGVTQVTLDHLWQGGPTWTPDHCKIVYVTDVPDPNSQDIYIMNADGSNPQPLIKNPGNDREPSLSPDGSRIVFMHEVEDNRQLFIVNADGSDMVQLTDMSETEEDPDWSPISEEIVFASNQLDDFNIYLIKSDGTGLMQLTDSPDGDRHPAWSPDGSQIAFLSNRTGFGNIYIMDKDGSNIRQITFHGAGDSIGIVNDLSWSKDGQWLATECGTLAYGNSICVVHPDGSDEHILFSTGMLSVGEPEW